MLINRYFSVSMLLLFAVFALNAHGEDLPEYKTKSVKAISYIKEPTDDKYREEMSKLDLYLPEGADKFPTLVYFHGGGLTGGKRSGPTRLVKKGVAVVAVEYRLYPKCKHPEYIEDCAAATAWVFKNITKYGGDPDKIFIGGYSAGGYLTSMLSMDKKWLAAEGVDSDKLAGALFQSGQLITHFTVRKQLGYDVKQGVCDENSPMYHIRKTQFPIILQCGNDDYPSRQQENSLFESMMIRYAHQSHDMVEYCEYKGTHGTLPKNPYFIKDTEWFILKHSGLPCPEREKEPIHGAVASARKFKGNYYLSVGGVEKGEVILDGEKAEPENKSTYKLPELPKNKSVTIVNSIPVASVPEVEEYVLKTGKENALSFDNGIKVWKTEDSLVFELDKKTSAIKPPKNNSYYTGDGIEIFIDRTPLLNVTDDMNSSSPEELNVKQYLFSAKPDSNGKSQRVLSQSQKGIDIASKAVMKSEVTDAGYIMQIMIPLSEISPLRGENVIGMDINVNDYESGSQKGHSISKSNAPSYMMRLHYPLFELD